MRRWLLIAAGLAACSGPTEKSDWERQHESQLPQPEEAVALPAYPAGERLIEFFVAATSEFRFFIDGASLSVDNDVVRYALVARSAAGTDNVSFEGMRCTTGEVRIYALGRDGGWVRRAGDWRAIQPRSVQRWHHALYREYFCPQREPIASRQEGIASLRRGGHPLFEDLPRGGSGSGW
ncbi:MAG TPA: CNP1-like family protein [Burkholderiales bacterium]|nr:CNP1-like family protein [Burkholderiales bacterium]